MDVSSYKCPCCGAALRFDSETQKLSCDSCDNSYEVKQLEQFDEATKESDAESSFDWKDYVGESVEGVVTYTCESCGGEIVGDGNTVATKCPYCDNVAIVEGHASGVLKPDLLIPFKLDKEAAKAALLKFCKKKPLLPKAFVEENHIDELTGIYVPFWLFDCDADAKITFDATKVTSWRAGDYRFTRTDYYAVTRNGNIGFSKIPVDGSQKMEDEYMDSIEPFDYADAVPFGTSYLAGYLADKFDVNSSDSLPRANDRVKNSTIEAFSNTVKGYSSVTVRSANVKSTDGDIKYALLPVWILNTLYKGKKYRFAMNGQTGKLVGELPVDMGKFWGFFAGIFAAIAIPLLLISLL